MEVVLVVLSALYAAAAFSATPAESLSTKNSTPYKLFYLVGGKETDAATAIIQSLNGRPAYKCVSVSASVSKSGTSIAVKNVKKPAKQN